MPIKISGSVGTGTVNTTTAPVDDNAIVRYDGTSGNNIQNSDITIDDSGNIQKVSSGTVDLFTDGQATVITVGESGGTFNVNSGDYTIGSTGATGTVSGSDLVIGDGQPTDQIAIQAGTINIGQSGATVNIQGTTNYQNVTNLEVTDKLITVNKGGSAGSGLGSGFEIEENSTITGYVKTSADRNSLEIKNPNQTGVASITLDSDNFTVDKTIVKGPTSGTDNKLVRTDGTNGRLIQESGITVNDTNDVSGVNSLSSGSISAPSITFGTASGILKATSGTVSATSITNSDVDASAGIVESKLTLDYSTSSLNSAIGTANTNLTNHLNDTTDAHDASAISNVPSGNLAATDQQAVNNELQGDIDTINGTLSTATSNISTLQTNVGNLITLSGVATNATDLGTFTGTTIPDNQTNKQALQALETAVESKASSTDLSNHMSDTTTHGTTGNIVGTSDAQVLTNKDIDGGTASNTNRITLPKASKTTLDGLTRKEATLVYASDLDKVYYDDGTTLRAVGSGSGSGINYVDNFDLEAGTTGYTGDTNLTISHETTSPLRGLGSLKIAKGAVNASTQTVTIDLLTIDPADLAKQMVISFDYDFSDANYSDGHARVQVIQDPNGTPVTIRVNGEDIKAGKGTHYARFQTDSTIDEYAVEIYWVNTGTSAVNAYIDNVQVGPKSIIYGSPITDKKSVTVTGSWVTNTTYTAFARRVGGDVELEVAIALTGAPTSADLTLTLPSEFPLDDAKLGTTTSFAPQLGTVSILDSGTRVYVGTAQRGSSASVVNIYTADTTAGDGAVDQANPFTFANGDRIFVNLKYPVVGWSANATMSEDFSGRDVYTRLTLSANESFADSAVEQILNFTASSDTTNSWSDTNNEYTVPESGYYDIALSLFFTSNTTGTRLGAIYVNGVEQSRTQVPAGSNLVVKTDAILLLNKGDLVTFYGFQSSGGALNLESSAARTYAYIAKRASAQQLFETETVVASYTSDSGQSNTTSEDVKEYEDLIIDTHNAYNTTTGEYTVPVTGVYEAVHRILLATHTPATTNTNCIAAIYVDGVSVESAITRSGTTSSTFFGATANMKARLLTKGQIVTFRASSSESISMSTTAIRLGFSIKRIK